MLPATQTDKMFVELTKQQLQQECSKNKSKGCKIQVYATIYLGGKNLSVPWHLIDMDDL